MHRCAVSRHDTGDRSRNNLYDPRNHRLEVVLAVPQLVERLVNVEVQQDNGYPAGLDVVIDVDFDAGLDSAGNGDRMRAVIISHGRGRGEQPNLSVMAGRQGCGAENDL